MFIPFMLNLLNCHYFLNYVFKKYFFKIDSMLVFQTKKNSFGSASLASLLEKDS